MATERGKESMDQNSRTSEGILRRKYRQYLLPSILTSLALALNEFVDSILVANLLGNNALAITNIGCVVILIIASCYVLLGNGGSTLYALFLGKFDSKSAGKVLTLSMTMALVLGLAIWFLGNVFSGPVTAILCVDDALRASFTSYYRHLISTAPVLVIMLTYVYFLPPSGAPLIATVVNITANGLNLIMDIVYIRYFHMGVEGAVYATITGYLVGGAVMLILVKKHNVMLRFGKLSLADLKFIPRICSQGSATAILQICYAIKYAYSNQLAVLYGGRGGILSFAVCLQSFSIASVFLLGVVDTAQPFLAMLSGQKDYKGEREVLIRSLRLQLFFSTFLIAFFLFYPQGMTMIYGLRDEEVIRQGIRGLRLFCLTYLTRGVAIQFMSYCQVEQRKTYSFCISLMDGFLVIPASYLLTKAGGLDGVFLAYSVSAALMLCVILAVNACIYSRDKDSYTGILLVKKEHGEAHVLNLSITDDSEKISTASKQMMNFCSEYGVTPKISMKVGLMCEEMAVYTHHHRKERGEIDFLLRIMEEYIIMNFRSIGEPFDPASQTNDDVEENLLMLKSLPHELMYDYIMGMNNTQITIERN